MCILGLPVWINVFTKEQVKEDIWVQIKNGVLKQTGPVQSWICTCGTPGGWPLPQPWIHCVTSDKVVTMCPRVPCLHSPELALVTSAAHFNVCFLPRLNVFSEIWEKETYATFGRLLPRGLFCGYPLFPPIPELNQGNKNIWKLTSQSSDWPLSQVPHW